MRIHQMGGGIALILLASFSCTRSSSSGGGAVSPQSFPSYLNVVATSPESGGCDVNITTTLSVTFDGPVDFQTLEGNFFVKTDGEVLSGTLSINEAGTTVTFAPSETTPLLRGKVYQFHITPGVKDTQGVPLFVETLSPFQTTAPFEGYLYPSDDGVLIPINASLAVWFTHPVNPSTVTSSTFQVKWNDTPISGSIEFQLENRVAVFHPENPLSQYSTYTIAVLGGESGVQSSIGEILASDLSGRFQTSSGNDGLSPQLSVTIHEIPDSMNSNLTIPPSLSEVDLNFSDGVYGFIQPGSLRLTANIPFGENAPAGTNLLTVLPIVSFDYKKVRVRIPTSLAITGNSVTFSATGTDLAGNWKGADPFDCKVEAKTETNTPFEHIQVCWARFDLDRDEENGSDFEEDLLVYGLTSEKNPIGKNAYLQDLIESKIVDQANELFQTSSWGRILVTRSAPTSALSMKIAVGGFDPTSTYESIDDPSTGVLGRAFFDNLNQNYNDDDTLLSPPLGVFPREMFRAYNQDFGPGGGDLLFTEIFSPISPELGGEPIGTHALDGSILDPSFDYAAASLAEQERYNKVFTAIDRFTKVIGFLLAHEIGHSAGLVPDELTGFFFHNSKGSAADVMLPTVSFTTISLLDVRFRPLNRSYFFQMILNV